MTVMPNTPPSATPMSNEDFMRSLHRVEPPLNELRLLAVVLGLAGCGAAYAFWSYGWDAFRAVALGVVLLVATLLWARRSAAEQARMFTELTAGWRNIVWIYAHSITRRNGVTHLVWFGLASGKKGCIGLDAPMSAAMRDEFVRRFPNATFGFDPAMEKRFVADPNSFRIAPRPEASAPRKLFRHPRELVLVNAAEKSIEASIVVLGSGAKRFVRSLVASGDASAPEHDGELEHVVMALGPIRGWTPRFFLYALEASVETIAQSAELAAIADAVVLVQASEEGTKLEPALFPLAKIVRGGKGALAFVGPRSALAELERDAEIQPDVASHDGAAMPVLKHLTPRILESLPAPRA